MPLNSGVEVSCVIEPCHADPDFGHLAFQHYLQYCDAGRRRLQEAYGVSNQALQEHGLGLIVRGVERAVYRQEIVPGDRVTVRSSFLPYERGPLVRMRHEMIKDGRVAFAVSTVHVFVDRATHRAVAPLDELVSRLRDGG